MIASFSQSMAHGESNVTKSTAMNVLPFDMTSEARNGLMQFKDNQVNWVELTLESEVIHLVTAVTVEAGKTLQGMVSGDDAR